MADAALQAQAGTGTIGVRPHLDRGFDPATVIIFLGLLGAGLLSNLIQASPRYSAMWMSMTKRIARSGSSYRHGCNSNPGPISAAAMV
jgi:hypothetical protein